MLKQQKSNMSDRLFQEVSKNINEIEGQVRKGCELSKEIKDTYNLWQKNSNNKEVTLKLKSAMDRWNRRYGTK